MNEKMTPYNKIMQGFTYLTGNLVGNPAAEVVAESLQNFIEKYWDADPVMVEYSDGTIEYFRHGDGAAQDLYKWGYRSTNLGGWVHKEDEDKMAEIKAIEFEEDKRNSDCQQSQHERR